ncbi:hypothetical protein K474DRAFT_1427356 [Panus rudis PR-1116 ss-1]|nr:hypothetical protein K474DRAFT_1427356 [Panus rudis PR-1116 ss-1]
MFFVLDPPHYPIGIPNPKLHSTYFCPVDDPSIDPARLGEIFPAWVSSYYSHSRNALDTVQSFTHLTRIQMDDDEFLSLLTSEPDHTRALKSDSSPNISPTSTRIPPEVGAATEEAAQAVGRSQMPAVLLGEKIYKNVFTKVLLGGDADSEDRGDDRNESDKNWLHQGGKQNGKDVYGDGVGLNEGGDGVGSNREKKEGEVRRELGSFQAQVQHRSQRKEDKEKDWLATTNLRMEIVTCGRSVPIALWTAWKIYRLICEHRLESTSASSQTRIRTRDRGAHSKCKLDENGSEDGRNDVQGVNGDCKDEVGRGLRYTSTFGENSIISPIGIVRSSSCWSFLEWYELHLW